MRPAGDSPRIPGLHIRRSDPAADEARALIDQSDRTMAALYPAESNHLESVAALQAANVAFFGAYVAGRLAACGAVKLLDDDGRYGEIKRLFVAETQRGKGIGRALMFRLEQHLRECGVPLARLETGIAQPEALGLYRSLGYRLREPFGRYRPDPLSVFMEKAILPPGEAQGGRG